MPELNRGVRLYHGAQIERSGAFALLDARSEPVTP
jgi:hypothetical protein